MPFPPERTPSVEHPTEQATQSQFAFSTPLRISVATPWHWLPGAIFLIGVVGQSLICIYSGVTPSMLLQTVAAGAIALAIATYLSLRSDLKHFLTEALRKELRFDAVRFDYTLTRFEVYYRLEDPSIQKEFCKEYGSLKRLDVSPLFSKQRLYRVELFEE